MGRLVRLLAALVLGVGFLPRSPRHEAPHGLRRALRSKMLSCHGKRLLQRLHWPRTFVTSQAGKLSVVSVDRSAEDAVQRIHQDRPQQVMLETCAQRLDLSKSVQEKTEQDVEVLSHADAIAFVHGGLRGVQLQKLSLAAEEVGAQIYCVDRPYRETQNRVAKRLLLHPKEMVAFARYSVASLGSVPKDGDPESCPEAVQKILGEEREAHMAYEVLQRSVATATAMVLCSPERHSALEQRLASSTPKAEISSTSRIWPFLLILVYVVIPGYGTIFVFWRLAKGVGEAISSWFSTTSE
eukprot:symbB.v1.2.030142.t1/scaffold3365.1/size58364/8